MIQELLYTSAPKGLKPGSRGFCTVLSTSGMPAPVATALESLSGYRPVYPPGDPQAKLNPVVYSHLKMSLGGRRSDVLSRVADYGLDYSQRTNKIAHHLVVDSNDRPSAGPAWLLAHPDVMRTNWEGEPHIVSGERQLPNGKSETRVCSHWKELTGDAGWAGVLAESFLKKPDQPAYIVFSPGMNLLPLIEEALALLPASKRWDVSFSTYFTKVPNGVTCNWRCVLADSPEAKESRRYVQSLRIDLTEPLGPATGGELVEIARTGRAHIETVQEPADATTSKAKSTPHETPSTAGAAPPIRVRDGRSVPIPRQRVSNYPVGHAEQAHGGTSRSLFKWVIALTLLALISGGGAVAMRTGWRPPNREKPSAPATPSEDSISVPEATEDVSRNSEGASGSAQRDTEAMSTTGTSQGGQSPMLPGDSNTVLPRENVNAMSAGEQSPERQSNAMAAGEQKKPEASPPGSNASITQDQQPKPAPREVYIHWSEAPPQLQVNQVYDIPLPDWITPDNAIVKAWCPTDREETFKTAGNNVQIRRSRNEEWETVVETKLTNKNDKPHLKITASSALSFSDYSKVVFTIHHDKDKELLHVFLSPAPTFSRKSTLNNTYDTVINLSTPIAHQSNNSPLSLKHVVFHITNAENTDDQQSRINITEKFLPDGSFLRSKVDTGVFSILSKQNLQDDLNTVTESSAKQIEELKIELQATLKSVGNTSELTTSINHAKFIEDANKTINKELNNISSKSLPPEISVDLGVLKNNNPGNEEFISHLTSKKINADKLAQKYETEGKDQNNEHAKTARQQSEQLDSVIKFYLIIKKTLEQLKMCDTEEVLISQVCKNGNDIKDIPVVVYRQGALSKNPKSEQ